MYKVTSAWPHQDQIKIEWNLGKRCNYDCTYCPSSIHDNHSPHTDINILEATVDKLCELGKPLRISLTGGEPCVNPGFAKLIRHCKEVGVSWISLTTNGTLPYEFYAGLEVDQIVFSIHLEFDWQRVFKTIERMATETNIKIIAQIMAHHKYMDVAKQLRTMCLLAEIPNTVRRIRWTDGDHDSFDDMRYQPDELSWIIKQETTVQGNCVIDNDTIMHANDVIKLHLNKYKGWTCHAGLESLMINWDGNVYRATCRVGNSLGNIYAGTFVITTEPITCDRNFCTCAADIPITKHLD